ICISAAVLTTSTLIPGGSTQAEAVEIMPEGGNQRTEDARKLRQDAAKNEVPLERAAFPHPTNGDEERFPSRIANFTKTLPHNDLGEVDPAAYQQLLNALQSGRFADFENIPAGGT